MLCSSLLYFSDKSHFVSLSILTAVFYLQSCQIPAERFKEVVEEVLNTADLGDKRASKMEQDDFLK